MKTNTTRTIRAHGHGTVAAVSVVLLTLLMITPVCAGTITVVDLPASGTDAASGIWSTNNYVCAFDYGNNGTTPTINGVAFTHVTLAGNNLMAITNKTDANFGGQVILTSGGPAANKLAQASSAGQGNLAAQADGSMRTLLTDLIYDGGVSMANCWVKQEFDSLQPGDDYSLRLYYRYWGNTVGGRFQDITFNGEGTNTAITLDEDAGGAHYVAYDFTATRTNVFCIMTNILVGTTVQQASMIYGATLQNTFHRLIPYITQDASAAGIGDGIYQFSVVAVGLPTLTYQWYSNSMNSYSGAAMVTDGNDYSGSASATLTATNHLLDYYYVVVANGNGSVTSSIVQINPAPTIVAQLPPTNVGNAYVAFTVTSSGLLPLTYQWYENTISNYTDATPLSDGNGYSGSTTSSLMTTTNLGSYYFVVVTNTYGAVTSAITAYNPLPMIDTQPEAFIDGSTVGFNVSASGWPTPTYQWYYNTVPDYGGATPLTDGGGVSGSTTTNVTIANLTAYYFFVAVNYYGSVTSSIVQLPQLTVLSAGQPIWNTTSQTNVIVTFSYALDPTTATIAGNYTLDNGATVNSAMLVASNEVLLTTSALTPSTTYTLTVQNVSNNWTVVQTPSPVTLTVGLYPANIAVWIRADSGVTTDPDTNTVSQWNDLSGNNNHFYQGGGAALQPHLVTNAWGDPVVRFNATDTVTNSMVAFQSSTLGITGDMSIVAVVNLRAKTGRTGHIVSKTGTTFRNIAAPYDYLVGGTAAVLYRGNGNGTVNGVHFGSSGATNGPSVGYPYVVAVSETGNTVSHYVNGKAAGTGLLSNNYQETDDYDQGNAVWIGARSESYNRLAGDLAELIVAGSPISAYGAGELANYLSTRHHFALFNVSPTNLVVAVTNSQMNLSWPADHTGWLLQSNSVGLTATGAWFTVSGSDLTNQITITPEANQTNVFYRMFFQQP